MKMDNNMIVLGLAAVAVYLITQSKKSPIAAKANTGLTATQAQTSEIFDINGGVFGNGWRYFSDGTAIDPQGNYYKGGQEIWHNPDAQSQPWFRAL